MIRRFIPKRLQNPLCWGSLLLNILLIAILLIGPHQLIPGFGPPKPGPAGFLEHMGRDLNNADKMVFDRILEKHRPMIAGNLEHMDEMLRSISKIVVQDTLVIEDLKQAHNKFDQAKFKMDGEIAAFLYEMLPALSVQGRKELRLLPPHLRDGKER